VHDLDRNLRRAGGGVLEVQGSTLRLSITWLQHDLSIPTSAIHSVVVVDPAVPDPFDGHAFQRVPRVLRLNTALTQRAGIAIVFNAPLLIDGFKYGAERGLPITATERKHGVPADVFVLDLPTPTAAANAVDDMGVRRSPNLALALSPLIPDATDSERAEHARKGRRATASIVVLMGLQLTIVVGAVSAKVQPTGAGHDLDWSLVVRNIVIGWGALAVGYLLGSGRPLNQRVGVVAPLGTLVLLPLLFISSLRNWGTVAIAVVVGVLFGWTLKSMLGRSAPAAT